jgi:hypothetical protein
MFKTDLILKKNQSLSDFKGRTHRRAEMCQEKPIESEPSRPRRPTPFENGGGKNSSGSPLKSGGWQASQSVDTVGKNG